MVGAMSEFNHQPTLTLETHRCWECGRFWAIEKGFTINSGTCPHCARRDLDKAEADRATLERSNRALRGAIARMRKRRTK